MTICVIPTNEELAIARKSAAIAEAGEDTYGNVFSQVSEEIPQSND